MVTEMVRRGRAGIVRRGPAHADANGLPCKNNTDVPDDHGSGSVHDENTRITPTSTDDAEVHGPENAIDG